MPAKVVRGGVGGQPGTHLGTVWDHQAAAGVPGGHAAALGEDVVHGHVLRCHVDCVLGH